MRAWLLSLTIVFAFVGLSEAKDPPTKGLRYASLTPDNKQVVFCYRGDIWVGDVASRKVTRLTIHQAQDTLARVSPDGKQVAFSSKRNGNYDVFVMPITGGLPKRVTFHSGFEAVCDWSPDGKKILFTSERDGDAGRSDLYEVDLDGGTPRRITFDGAREGTYSPDGKQIVYVRGYITIYWDNYKGAANFDIYVTDTKGGTPRRLTSTPGNERWPFFSADAKTIYFVGEEKKVANFYSMPIEGGKRTQITKIKGADVHRPDLSWDWKTAVFERAGQLQVCNLAAAKAREQSIPFTIRSDERSSGIENRTITSGGEHVHVSMDGRNAAFSLRGDIWVMPAAGGKGRRVIDGPSKEEWPRWSPDGTKLAFQSNRTGNTDIFIHDLRTKRTRQLTKNRANDFFFNWSPDGRTIVFCSERSGNRDIWTIDVESGSTKQLTRHPGGDDDPSFSPDGKQIAFDSARGGSPAIYVMGVDGKNVRRISQGAGFYQVPSFSPDGKMLVYEGFVPVGGRSGGLYVVGRNGGQSMLISRDGAGACWRGDYIYFTSNRGPHGDGVWRVKAPESVEAGEKVPFIGTVQVDQKKELANLFDEAWTAMRDNFYDAKMHGVDWNAMRKKYRDMAIDAENKDEFHNVVRQLLAELGASHLGIFGGAQQGNTVTPPRDATGYLGVEFETAPLEDGARRVAKVLRGGPADRAGIRVGDVVTRIGRRKLGAKTNLDKVLTGTVGKSVVVTYKPKSEGGLGLERSTPIEPIPFMAMRGLKQKNWVQGCGRRVKDATKGSVAYLHLSQMNPQNLNKFQQTIAKLNRSKKNKGLVLDVRDNGGGNIHNQLMSVLWAKPLARVQSRGGPEMIQPALYWDRPIVLLINERSFSDAEVFPYMFKAAGIGKIIGVPTAGGVIGTRNITLSDGSSFRLPRTGFKTMKGVNLEGLGVSPDILVEETSEDRRLGRDPQLAKAIAVIQAEIAAKKGPAKPAKAKPEAKPAPKTEPKPEPKPAPEAKPVTEAKPQPEAAAAAPTKPADPLYDAKAGEWIKIKRFTPHGQELEIVIRVDEVTPTEVVLKQTILMQGREIPGPTMRRPRRQSLEPSEQIGEATGYSSEEVKVAGKVLKCIVMTAKDPGSGEELKWLVSPDVPVDGLVRFIRGGKVMMEVVEWGTPDSSAGPAKR
ncbi:MAG: S41 family peptidase [Planctomycetota bacterium]|jgi:Tol biopolymer transport system component/C-terminal processing protease CtpA/Prc